MKWVLLFVVYAAPDDAVNWNGPWEAGMVQASEAFFDSFQSCKAEGKRIKDRIHEGMRAPIRYHCVPVDAELAEGAAL